MLAVHHVVPRANVNRAVGLLALAHDEDVVPLLELRLANLLLHLAIAIVNLAVEALLAKHAANLMRIVPALLADGHDHHLPGREPEGPLPRKVLGEDRKHALHGAEDGAVDDDRALGLVRLADVRQVETDGQLEIELHGGALEPSLERVKDGDVNLGTVEGAIAGVELPLLARTIQRRLQRSLRLVPGLQFAEVPLGPGGELHLVGEAEDLVNLVEHLHESRKLLLHLILAAEDVRVVLLESAHASETVQRAAELVAVEHAKVGEPHGQLAEGSLAVAKHHAVPGAVHRLQAKLRLLHVEREHVLLVMRRVTGGLPQVEVVHVRGDDLVVLVLPVLLADELHQLVVNLGALRQEEARARGEGVEEEELLVETDQAVVALLRLLDAKLVLGHELLVGEGDGVDADQGVLGDVGSPVRPRALVDGHRLDPRGVGKVGAAAEVDHGAAAVAGDGGVLREVADELNLELILLEHLQRLGSAHHDALEGLLLLDDRLHALLDAVRLAGAQRAFSEEAIVVESLLDGGSDGEVGSVLELERLAEDVRG